MRSRLRSPGPQLGLTLLRLSIVEHAVDDPYLRCRAPPPSRRARRRSGSRKTTAPAMSGEPSRRLPLRRVGISTERVRRRARRPPRPPFSLSCHRTLCGDGRAAAPGGRSRCRAKCGPANSIKKSRSPSSHGDHSAWATRHRNRLPCNPFNDAGGRLLGGIRNGISSQGSRDRYTA